VAGSQFEGDVDVAYFDGAQVLFHLKRNKFQILSGSGIYLWVYSIFGLAVLDKLFSASYMIPMLMGAHDMRNLNSLLLVQKILNWPKL
jgi:hypothetical protein